MSLDRRGWSACGSLTALQHPFLAGELGPGAVELIEEVAHHDGPGFSPGSVILVVVPVGNKGDLGVEFGQELNVDTAISFAVCGSTEVEGDSLVAAVGRHRFASVDTPAECGVGIADAERPEATRVDDALSFLGAREEDLAIDGVEDWGMVTLDHTLLDDVDLASTEPGDLPVGCRYRYRCLLGLTTQPQEFERIEHECAAFRPSDGGLPSGVYIIA